MRKFVKEVGQKMDHVYCMATRRIRNYVVEKKEGGFETFVIILLIIAICCGIAAIFKDQLTEFMKEVFTELKGDILTDFIKKPTV